MKKINYKETIELVCRLYVFFFLAAYGIGKVIGAQFYTPDAIPPEIATLTIHQLSDFDLAWVFMGRSYGYMAYIGIGELLGAVLLLFNRTKLLGTFILIPILVNVVVFDIFFLDEYGALASAIIYLLMLFVILWVNAAKILKAFKALTQFETIKNIAIKERLVKYAVVLAIILVVFAMNQFMVSWLGYGKG